MAISVFDLFKIGIGPSSSHTVGPMKIAKTFAKTLQDKSLLEKTSRIHAELFGSLGATGHGHGSDSAVVLGLLGEEPESVDTDSVEKRLEEIKTTKKLSLLKQKQLSFDFNKDITLHLNKFLPYHSNAITLHAFDENSEKLFEKTYYSIGGGFVLSEDEIGQIKEEKELTLPYEFNSAQELLALCKEKQLKISELMMANEKVLREESIIRQKLLQIWTVMQESVQRGCEKTGHLPGAMRVKRRAHEIYERLSNKQNFSMVDPLEVMDWIDLYALAVNEENACGGRVVTAPTNGAAGIIPAVMHYMCRFLSHSIKEYDENAVINFLLTAGAIGILYQKNASISGADVGCQGEVGVACSMAAGALAEFMGGSIEQVENAAEIGMEHNLGLTCDPVGGLVQVPCIERNAMASMKAVNAARMALNGDGHHYVSLDQVIKTMFETGKDMMNKYKETSQGGLAVNIIEC